MGSSLYLTREYCLYTRHVCIVSYCLAWSTLYLGQSRFLYIVWRKRSYEFDIWHTGCLNIAFLCQWSLVNFTYYMYCVMKTPWVSTCGKPVHFRRHFIDKGYWYLAILTFYWLGHKMFLHHETNEIRSCESDIFHVSLMTPANDIELLRSRWSSSFV